MVGKTFKDVSGRPHEKESRGEKTPKKRQIKRNKIRMTVWWTPENHQWLKKNIANVSNFLNNVIDGLRGQIQPNVILISPVEPYIGRARGLAWIKHWPSKPGIGGSNPPGSAEFFA